jgi:hypothetical protein
MLTPWWLIKLTKEVRSSRGVQPSPAPAPVQTRLNISGRCLGPGGAAADGEDQPGVLPAVPAASRSSIWDSCRARSAWTAAAGRARVRGGRSVLVSPCARTDMPAGRQRADLADLQVPRAGLITPRSRIN